MPLLHSLENLSCRRNTDARGSLDLLLSLLDRATAEQTATICSHVLAVKGAVTSRQRWARQFRDNANPQTADLLRDLQLLNRDLLRSALSAEPAGKRSPLS